MQPSVPVSVYLAEYLTDLLDTIVQRRTFFDDFSRLEIIYHYRYYCLLLLANSGVQSQVMILGGKFWIIYKNVITHWGIHLPSPLTVL
jgi:hypothetical protein